MYMYVCMCVYIYMCIHTHIKCVCTHWYTLLSWLITLPYLRPSFVGRPSWEVGGILLKWYCLKSQFRWDRTPLLFMHKPIKWGRWLFLSQETSMRFPTVFRQPLTSARDTAQRHDAEASAAPFGSESGPETRNLQEPAFECQQLAAASFRSRGRFPDGGSGIRNPASDAPQARK